MIDHEPAPVKVSYKIVRMIEGRMTVTTRTDIYAWAQANGFQTRETGLHTRSCVRAELRQQPAIEGLCGPMWDGEIDGVAVIRYEDQATYNILST